MHRDEQQVEYVNNTEIVGAARLVLQILREPEASPKYSATIKELGNQVILIMMMMVTAATTSSM
jgi:BarA-like signal transduction histidine kinase